jgi:hypothetical protein
LPSIVYNILTCFTLMWYWVILQAILLTFFIFFNNKNVTLKVFNVHVYYVYIFYVHVICSIHLLMYILMGPKCIKYFVQKKTRKVSRLILNENEYFVAKKHAKVLFVKYKKKSWVLQKKKLVNNTHALHLLNLETSKFIFDTFQCLFFFNILVLPL